MVHRYRQRPEPVESRDPTSDTLLCLDRQIFLRVIQLSCPASNFHGGALSYAPDHGTSPDPSAASASVIALSEKKDKDKPLLHTGMRMISAVPRFTRRDCDR